MTELIRCIYCQENAPSSAEHVLLEGLGGELTIPWVCRRCNHDFGNTIDRGLLRESPFAVRRVLDLATDSHKVTFFYNANLGGHFDLIGDSLLPQVFLSDTGGWNIVGITEATSGALRRLLFRDKGRTRRIVRDCSENHPTRLVIEKRSLVLRARTVEQADFFEERLRSSVDVVMGLAERYGHASPVLTSPDSHVLLTMNCDPNWPSRCGAKMLFNLAAHHFGASFLYRTEFDSVRDFIAGRDVAPVETITGPDGETGWTMDERHVGNWLQPDPRDEAWPRGMKGHGLLLDRHDGILGGMVILWGRPTFKVKLAQFDPSFGSVKALPIVLVKDGRREEVIQGVFGVYLRLGFLDPTELQ